MRPDLNPEALEQKEIMVHRTDTDVMDQWQLVRTDTDAMVQCQLVMIVDSHVLYTYRWDVLVKSNFVDVDR